MLDTMQVAAEEGAGAEAVARAEVRGEGIAVTEVLKTKLLSEVRECRGQSTKVLESFAWRQVLKKLSREEAAVMCVSYFGAD